MRFEIGQTAWVASWKSETKSVICPDCGGQGRIRVLLHDDTVVSIECGACKSGYNPACGMMSVREHIPVARYAVITGVEISGGETRWQTHDNYRVDDHNIFVDEDAALERAREMATDADREEADRVNHKEKPTKTWAWHVHYHRRAIRDAVKQVEYHKSRLAVANLKAKTGEVG